MCQAPQRSHYTVQRRFQKCLRLHYDCTSSFLLRVVSTYLRICPSLRMYFLRLLIVWRIYRARVQPDHQQPDLPSRHHGHQRRSQRRHQQPRSLRPHHLHPPLNPLFYPSSRPSNSHCMREFKDSYKHHVANIAHLMCVLSTSSSLRPRETRRYCTSKTRYRRRMRRRRRLQT